MKKTLTVIHGPNLNRLGLREPHIYGKETLEQLNNTIRAYADSKNIELKIVQHNSEGDIIESLQTEEEKSNGFVINPAAYTHTSVAIRDAILGSQKPVVEVHLSNLHTREDFRKKSITADACIGQISGFGSYSYILAIKALIEGQFHS